MTVQQNRFGLTKRDISTIKSIFDKYPEVKIVHLFGSRAKGNYRFGSDVDLAIMNEGVGQKELIKLKSDFEESSLPYNIDLVDFTKLNKQAFTDHIKRVGVLFYTQDEKELEARKQKS